MMTQQSDPRSSRSTLGAAFAVAAALALAGCGGADGSSVDSSSVDTVAADAAVPPSASVDAPAFTSFTSSLQPNDNDEPVALGDFVPPQDDTAEPTPVGG